MGVETTKKNSSQLFIKELRIQNFATFENQEVFFKPGLNVLVGETGSGKSLILDALQLVLGQRADKKSIRKNSDFACVEVLMTTTDKRLKEYLEEIGHPLDNNEISIKRILYPNGQTKNYFNFQSCALVTISNFSREFVDLVGQFENQKLLNSEYQLSLLDQFSNLDTLKSSYKESFRKFISEKNELADLIDRQNKTELRREFLLFSIAELEDLSPDIDLEKHLLEKKTLILGSKKNQEIAKEMQFLFCDEEGERSILSDLKKVKKIVEKNQTSFSSSLHQKIIELVTLAEEFSFSISKGTEEVDESQINDVVDTLDKYQKLKKKYNCDTEKLISYLQEFKGELQELSSLKETIERKEKELLTLESNTFNLALKLHDKRLKNSKDLESKLTKAIRDLNMDGASLKIDIHKQEILAENGLTKLSFLAETNIGHGHHKVKEIASGGELSRILLSMRQILSEQNSISIFLFDEIDTGVGGKTAISIGKSLSEVSKNSQVIAITHLPQIATFSDHMIWVSKEMQEKKKRVHSKISYIDKKSKTDALNVMSGGIISEAQLNIQ